MMFQKILVPLDGSSEAEGILPYVSRIAVGLEASVVLLSVMDRDGLGMSGSQRSTLFARAELEVRNRLHNASHRLRGRAVRTEEVVVTGRAEEEVTAVAERLGCDLIAMSTHGRSVLGKGILGSVTDRVIHTATVPMLTVAQDKTRTYRGQDMLATQVIVPLDGSRLAESALPYVRDLAGKLSWQVALVRVVRPMRFLWVGDFTSGMSEDHDLLESEAKDYLRTVAESLREDGLAVEWQVLFGHPTTTILDLVRKIPHNIVALSTQGRSGFRRWFIGSLAETLVRSSGASVLMVPSSERIEQAVDNA